MKRSLKDHIIKVINRRNYDLKKRLPYGFVFEMAKQTGKSTANVQKTIQVIRASKGIVVQKKKKIILSRENGFHSSCLDNNFIRSSPSKEAFACKLIIKQLRILPEGGAGMLIGTPTPFCISHHPKYNKHILDDNLEVAHILKYTTDHLTIVIGNGIDKAKAEAKADLWKRLFSFSNADIKIESVNRDSYTRLLTIMSERNSLCKIVLMTSGSWGQSKKILDKYNWIDTNFKTPSEYLTSIYPNLHILAMTVGAGYIFGVKYLHNGINKNVE